MGRNNKLDRFEEIGVLPNVYQYTDYKNPQLTNHKGEIVDMKGKWNQHFGNDNPIILELACGKGDYARALAKAYPNKNCKGVCG